MAEGEKKKMTVSQHPKFDARYPEEFPLWQAIESHKLTGVANEIRVATYRDLKTADRILAPGLRAALLEIAKVAEL
jgi:hypothetical protein